MSATKRATSKARKITLLLFSVAVLLAADHAAVRGHSALVGFDPNGNGTVYSIVEQADGKILAGGAFNGANSIGGQMRNYIARLDGTTGLADSFNPNANNTVFTIVVQADGKILVGGFFNGANS